ncbi:hypothetical protein BIY27_19340 [Gibbsiella quercinecans]|uniref:SOS response-associated peptidase family protein n=1 Tax=Gibbsiella quercinecans TaxID=929813 RepID=UPI000EF1E4D4|nr:SOS response-associated peptidase family protein [Gibbsiella quercinecans]RLM06679.1 hypothetical protein BIY27_19340 [Gibbsiella quercinecans]
MCGRFAQFHSREEFLATLQLETPVIAVDDWSPRYNIAPGTQVQIIHNINEQLQLTPIHWGM